jgi:two-component system, chemotaxis family, sensor kinase CheA
MIQDDDILQEFVVESVEHLADVESQLLEIEEGGSTVNHDLVNTVFRAIHSVKGAAGFLGLVRINELAHNLENVLNQVRNQELVPTHGIVDRLLRSADMLRTMISNVHESNSMDVSSQVEELKQILRGEVLGESATDDIVDRLENVVDFVDAVQEPAEAVHSNGVESTAEIAVEKQPAAATKHNSLEVAHPHAKASPAAAPKQDAKASAKVVENNVRVNVGILDRLMNLAGELVLGRNQLLQSVNSKSSHEHLAAVASRLDQVTSELQEAIMQTRMQPVGAVFNRFPRVVRDLSAKLGKSCSLEIEGSDVEVDKTIIEAIGDPLTHLIRNAVDHGIEKPEVRVANGKKAEGIIHLRAFHQAGKVCVRIEDNGGGIDPARIKAKALSNGLISEAEAAAMSLNDTLRLIFAPGFSTAAQITDVSGRGVGMDVVKTNIEQIGGTVDVESELGKGSAIHITLPLTLAIIPSMIVGCGDSKFAIPQANIVELVRIPATEVPERVGAVQGAEVLRLRGALLPLIRLNGVFGLDEVDQSVSRGNMHIIVVETGHYRFGVQVDALFDSEEIVVKPLGRQLRDLDYLAGATILGDGRVALILDIMGLAAHANLRTCEELLEIADSDQKDQFSSEVHRMLLFNNAPSEQFAIPMACVSRIERSNVNDFHYVGGSALLPYRGATLPLLFLENHISAAPRQADLEHLFVIVFSIGTREVGLAAPILKDIRNVALQVDDSAVCEPGVSGIFVLDNQPTRLLDLIGLIRSCHPEWIKQAQPASSAKQESESPASKLVLFAEDSSFFRRHVEQTLSEEGYELVTAVDGKDAWEKLQQMDPLPRLVLTDVEMPNMSGLELCKAVRGDARTKHLPVIALTSLASETDISRGKDVGVDDYQIKLDKTNLLASIARHILK